jgi:hemerythrin-like domain-containing protein
MNNTRTEGAAALEMPIIHRIFRTEFASLGRLVTEVDPTDRDRVRAVAEHLGFMLDGLHMHHTTEDDLVWPRLVERAGLDRPKVERMEEQHHQIDVAVAEVRQAGGAWLASPSDATAAALADRVRAFLGVLEPHLDEEEREVVPLIDRYLSADEWEQVGKEAFDKFTPAQRWIATGQLVEVATPEETALMFAKLPPPVKLLWRLFGQRKYRRYIEPIRRTAR